MFHRFPAVCRGLPGRAGILLLITLSLFSLTCRIEIPAHGGARLIDLSRAWKMTRQEAICIQSRVREDYQMFFLAYHLTHQLSHLPDEAVPTRWQQCRLTQPPEVLKHSTAYGTKPTIANN